MLYILVASAFRGVANMGLRGPIFVPLKPQIGLWSFSQKVSTGFTSILVYMSILGTLKSVEYWPQMPNSRVILGPEIDYNSGLHSFSQKFSTGFTQFTNMLIGVLLGAFQLSASKALLLGLE